MQLFSMIVLASPKKKVPKPYVAVGLTLAFMGFALRFWSTGYAGIATRTNSEKPPSTLITNGPFRYSRNPIYIGNQLMFAGTLLCIGQGLKSLMFSAAAFSFYSLITRYEEEQLAEAFGKKYIVYKNRTPRWFPTKQSSLISLIRTVFSLDFLYLITKTPNGRGDFSLSRALQTEKFTAYNCANLFLLRRSSIAARQRLGK